MEPVAAVDADGGVGLIVRRSLRNEIQEANNMALIKCPEPDCEGMVSSAADSCPHCGCPIGGIGRRREVVVTTQGTLKRIKKMEIIAMVVPVFGIGGCMLCSSYTDSGKFGVWDWIGILSVAIFLILAAYTAVMRWWHHE